MRGDVARMCVTLATLVTLVTLATLCCERKVTRVGMQEDFVQTSLFRLAVHVVVKSDSSVRTTSRASLRGVMRRDYGAELCAAAPTNQIR